MKKMSAITAGKERRQAVLARYYHHLVHNCGKERSYCRAAAEFDSEKSPLSPRTVSLWVQLFEHWGQAALERPALYTRLGLECRKRARLKASDWSRQDVNCWMRRELPVSVAEEIRQSVEKLLNEPHEDLSRV